MMDTACEKRDAVGKDSLREFRTTLIENTKDGTTRTTGVYELIYSEETGRYKRPYIELKEGETIVANAHTHTLKGGDPSQYDWDAAIGRDTDAESAPEYVITPSAMWRLDPGQGDEYTRMHKKMKKSPGNIVMYERALNNYVTEGNVLRMQEKK